MMVLSPSCKSIDKIGNICLSLIFLENSLRQSLRVCFLRMCHPSSASLKESGRESGKDWQQIRGVELLRWPLLHKGPQTNVAGSSAGDHSVTKDLFGQNVWKFVPGTIRQREKRRESITVTSLCFLSSIGQMCCQEINHAYPLAG